MAAENPFTGSPLLLPQQAMSADASASGPADASQFSQETYQFPLQKLRRRQAQDGRTPLVLVACGSFSPPTFLHLRMFAMAWDSVRIGTNYEIMGAYMSPVSDAYNKVGLAPAENRVRMCDLATRSSKWVSVDGWEALQPQYVPTAAVLDRFEHEINTVQGGVEDVNGNPTKVQIALLAGADLLQSMSQPGLWSPHDLQHILGDYGVFVLERAGTDLDEAVSSLKQWGKTIYRIPQVVPNEVSSTKIRMLLRRDMSVDYLLPADVIEYIKENGLYRDEDADAAAKKARNSETSRSTDKGKNLI